jgi:hypothetical protein
MKHPALKNIDPAKLELFQMAVKQTQGKSGNDIVPIMLALITNANKKGLTFTNEEVGLIIELLKEGKTKEEKSQIDQMVKMIQSFSKKK